MTYTTSLGAADADHATGVHGHLYVLIWRKLVSKPAHDNALAGIKELSDKFPDGMELITVIEPTASRPSDEIRRDAATMFSNLGPKLRCVAAVIEGSGFVPAAMRSILAGIMLVARPNQPTKLFGTVRDAGAWINTRAPLAGPDIELAVAKVRASIRG